MFPKDYHMRRAGYAVWVGTHHPANFGGPLGGPVQTAYRAELRAMVHAAEHISGTYTIVSDCKGVVNGAERILRGGVMDPNGRHQDLWARLAAALRGCAGVRVRWVPAHTNGPCFAISRRGFEGNNWADILAKNAATAAGPSPRQAWKYFRDCRRCKAIQALQIRVLKAVHQADAAKEDQQGQRHRRLAARPGEKAGRRPPGAGAMLPTEMRT